MSYNGALKTDKPRDKYLNAKRVSWDLGIKFLKQINVNLDNIQSQKNISCNIAKR
jgi:hypothetical protein